MKTWLLCTTRVVSASSHSGSPSKSESLVKDDSRLAVAAKKQLVRKFKPCSGGGDLTELGEMHGRGAGVNS